MLPNEQTVNSDFLLSRVSRVVIIYPERRRLKELAERTV